MSAKKTVKIKNALDKDANSLSNVVEKAELWLLPIAVDARADSNVEAAIYFASRHKKEVIDADNLKESWYESICEDIERGEHFAKLGKEVKKRVKLKTISLAEASEVLSGNHTNSLSRFFDCHDCRDYNEEDFIDATFFRAVDWLSIVGFEPWLDSLSHYTASRLTGVAEHINGIWYLFFWCRSNQAMDSTGIIPLQAALWTLMRGSVEESKPWIKPPSLTQNKCFGDITVAGLLPFIWHRINPSGLDYKIITEALGFLFQTQMRSGGWPFSTTESKPGIWPTCVAIHSLAMTKPRGWEQMCKKASEWLITQQTKDGYWHVSEVPAVMITVLVLDSINLANNSDNVTFRMSNRINHLQEEKVNQTTYDWSIHTKREVYCNGQRIAQLPNLQFKLFECLYKKPGKYVKNETLEKCWGDKKPDYKNYLPTAMSQVQSKLKEGLVENKIHVKGNVIEPKQENKKNVSYKLVT